MGKTISYDSPGVVGAFWVRGRAREQCGCENNAGSRAELGPCFSLSLSSPSHVLKMDLQAVAGSIVLGSRTLKVPLCGQSFLRGQGRCDYRQGRKPFHCMCTPPCGDLERNLLEGEACTWRAHVDTMEGRSVFEEHCTRVSSSVTATFTRVSGVGSWRPGDS